MTDFPIYKFRTEFIEALFSILKTNWLEIYEPEEGWPEPIYQRFPDIDKNGRFHLRRDGNIDYVSYRFQALPWSQRPMSLKELAVKQLEDLAFIRLSNQAARSKVPNVEFLLRRFYRI